LIRISVITVCYNSAKTLERTLSSVAEQTWTNKQHIVIDGASQDGSLEILNRHKHQLDYVLSEPDAGIYDAMNKGLLQVNGDIICFLNADDYYTSDKVLSFVASAMSLNNLDALTADVDFFHENKPERIVRRYRSDRFNTKKLAWGWMPAHPGLFLRSQLVRRVGYFKPDYKIAGDFEYIIRVFYSQHAQYKHYPEVLVRMQTGGVSDRGWQSKILLNKEMLRACRENGIKTNLFKLMSRYPLKLLEIFPSQ
jgi:glycosyltransferase involved in cell wall biosynthesis